jgi:hypothetical protein
MKFRDDVETGSGGEFLKIKDGQTVVGVLRGEPVEFYQLWQNGKPTEVAPGTKGASFRFKVNIVVKDGTNYVAKIFSQGATVYNRLKHLNSKRPLESNAIEITRKGSTKDDTEYQVDFFDGVVPEASWAKINAVKLQNLDQRPQAKPEPPFAEDNFGEPPPEAFNEHPEIPF